MTRYILKRLLLVIPVLIGVSFVVYFITDLAPGDAADVLASGEMTLEEIEALRESMGLNRSVFIRYGEYMLNLLRGDMGTSFANGKDVFQTYMSRLPETLKLAVASTVFSAGISIPLGIYTAKHRGSWQDSGAMIIALLGLSMPGFFVGLMLIILFSLKLRILPSGGDKGILYIIMPAISAGASMLATMTRTTRSAMLDALSMDYLDLARSKGVSEKQVINKHALKNALIPIITIVGTQFAGNLGGVAVVEKLFSWPGVGSFIVDGVSNRDIPVVCGGVILSTALVTITLLVIDILYAFVDPRIKAKYSRQSARKKRKEGGVA